MRNQQSKFYSDYCNVNCVSPTKTKLSITLLRTLFMSIKTNRYFRLSLQDYDFFKTKISAEVQRRIEVIKNKETMIIISHEIHKM